MEVLGNTLCNDDADMVTDAGRKSGSAKGADVVVCTGGMSVDPDDRTPLAIRNATDDGQSHTAPLCFPEPCSCSHMRETSR